jgi:hypothetical protein
MSQARIAAMKNAEPDRLRRGKAVHRRIQDEWEDTAEGDVWSEKPITKPGGGPGRIDVHVQADEELVAVVEIKNSDWDAMTEEAVRRNAKRYARQLWNYIEAEIEGGFQVSPGIVFPTKPKTERRCAEIERLFEDDGIPVVWEDETIEERRARG